MHFFDIEWPSDRPKVVRTCGVLPLFTSKCASRHNGAHFFHIATSKSRPNMVCFATFDLKMCFAPQRRALFPHRSFQNSSGPEVFCHFLLPNVLRATTACTFSTSQLPKVLRDRRVLTLFTSNCAPHHKGVHFFDIPISKMVREWCVLTLFTSKCASRHNGVHFFHISTSKSGPNPTCFNTF